jgi:ribosomal 30S subunit maturation factor RimM
VVAIEIGPQDRLVDPRRLSRGRELERLLPVVDAFIADIDLEAKRITITPPDGFPEEPL